MNAAAPSFAPRPARPARPAGLDPPHTAQSPDFGSLVDQDHEDGLRFPPLLPSDISVVFRRRIAEYSPDGPHGSAAAVLAAALEAMLRLPADRFFAHVLRDPSLRVAVDSVLRYAPRAFDLAAAQASFPPDPYVEACVKGSLLLLHRSLVEPLPPGLAEPERGRHLHASGAITLPRLLDAAALCGTTNKVLASALCARALAAVPQLAGDVASLRGTLAKVAGQVAGALPSARDRLRASASAGAAASGAAGGALTATEEDLLAYWADIAATLSTAVDACPSLAVAFLGPDAARDAASEDAVPAPGASAVQDVHGGDGHSALAGAARLYGTVSSLEQAALEAAARAGAGITQSLPPALRHALATAQPAARRFIADCVVMLCVEPLEDGSSWRSQRIDPVENVLSSQQLATLRTLSSRPGTLLTLLHRASADLGSVEEGICWSAAAHHAGLARRVRSLVGTLPEADDSRRCAYLADVLAQATAIHNEHSEAAARRRQRAEEFPSLGTAFSKKGEGPRPEDRAALQRLQPLFPRLGDGFLLACLRHSGMDADAAAALACAPAEELPQAVARVAHEAPLHVFYEREEAQTRGAAAAEADATAAAAQRQRLSALLLSEEERESGLSVQRAWRGKQSVDLPRTVDEEQKERVLRVFAEYDAYADDVDEEANAEDRVGVDDSYMEDEEDARPAASPDTAQAAVGEAGNGAHAQQRQDREGRKAGRGRGRGRRGAQEAAAARPATPDAAGAATAAPAAAGSNGGAGRGGRGGGRGRGGPGRGDRGRGGRGRGGSSNQLSDRQKRFRQRNKAKIGNHNRKARAAKKAGV